MPEFRLERSKATEDLPEVIEPLAEAVAGASPAARRRILAAATRGQRLLCGLYFYRDDVTNGGHRQYFWNYTGDLWPEAVEAVAVLRLPEARILRAAVALFPGKRPGPTRRERRGQLARIGRAKFDRLDDRFYTLPGGRDEAVRRYIAEHPEEFFLPERSG